MKILIVSDAWLPQINGVVRTLQATQKELEKAGHQVLIVGPDPKRMWTIPAPGYPEISLEFFASGRLAKIVSSFRPASIHISTEGPLGWSMRRLCMRSGYAFTTAYHTQFPEYLSVRSPLVLRGIVKWLAYLALRRFHNAASAVMVATKSVELQLLEHGFEHVVRWSRGVDTEQFLPWGKFFEPYKEFQRPILLYVGRVSTEKNIQAFLSCHSNGTKVVVGAGPDLQNLTSAYPDAKFLGAMDKELLAKAYAAADLFVFPSKSDTFGLVLLEACAAGLRIAAYPVSGPKDVFVEPEAKAFTVLDDDLCLAIDKALSLPESPRLPRQFAEKHSWQAATREFEANLHILTLENTKNAGES